MRFLNKIERLVHLDMTYFLTGGFWLWVGQFGALILSFVSSLVFARFLSAETYGTYRYLSSIIVIISLFSLSGLGAALTQAVAMGKEGTLRLAFKTQLRWSLLMTVISLSLGIYSLGHNNSIFFWVFFILGVTGPFYYASGLYDSILSGQGKFRQATIYNLIVNIITSSFLIFAAFSRSFFLLLFPIQYVIQTILGLFFYTKIAKGVPKNAPVDKETIKYGKHLSLIYILAAIADQADNIILFIIAGPINLAVYAFAVAIPEIIKGFLKTIAPLSLPKLANTDSVIFLRSLPIRITQILIVTGFIIFLYIISAPLIFTLLFPAYQKSIYFSQIFSLSLLAAPFYLINAFFQAKKMIKHILLVNTVSPIFQIILMTIFTYLFGLPGLIFARVMGRIANLIFSLSLLSVNL